MFQFSRLLSPIFFLCFFNIGTLFSGGIEQSELAERLQEVLIKDDSLNDILELDVEEMKINCKETGNTYSVALNSIYKHPLPDSLEGIKIAIDAGFLHRFPFEQLEPRFICEGHFFSCAELNLLLAERIEKKFQQLGVEVLLSKGLEEDVSYELSYQEVKKADLEHRAKTINAFQPDLTLVIQLNLHQFLNETTNEPQICRENFSICFIPGAFLKGELDRKKDVESFCLLIQDNTVESSIAIAREIQNALAHRCGIESVSSLVQEKSKYIQTVCKPMGHGIFARNLYLLRNVHGLVVYSMPSVLNSEETTKRILENKNQWLDELAQSYVDAICNLFEI